MAQFARPDSGTDFSFIDEVVADDADYSAVTNGGGAGPVAFSWGLSDVTDPVSSSGHVIRVRSRFSTTGIGGCSFALYQTGGAANIANVTLTAGVNFATDTYTLTAAEADSITDYNALNFTAATDDPGEGAFAELDVSWAELEVPDATPKPKPMFRGQA